MNDNKLNEILPKIRETANELEKILVQNVTRAELGTKYKIPYKVVVVKEVYKHRLYDLLLSIYILLKTDKHIPVIILERAIMELVSVVSNLKNILKCALETKDLAILEKESMILLVGYRFEINEESNHKVEDTEDYKSKNILGYVDKMDKILPDFRQCYDALSEFVHPNFCGCTNSYSENDEINYTTYFGFDPLKDINFYVATLNFINNVVEKFIQITIEMDLSIKELISLCKEKEQDKSIT